MCMTIICGTDSRFDSFVLGGDVVLLTRVLMGTSMFRHSLGKIVLMGPKGS